MAIALRDGRVQHATMLIFTSNQNTFYHAFILGVAVGDNTGSICLFGDRQSDSLFNRDSWMTVFPTLEESLPSTSIHDINSAIAAVPTPLPPPNGYCSDFWPKGALERQCRRLKPIPNEIIQSAKSTHSVLYAKNPRHNTQLAGLNVCPYDLGVEGIIFMFIN